MSADFRQNQNDLVFTANYLSEEEDLLADFGRIKKCEGLTKHRTCSFRIWLKIKHCVIVIRVLESFVPCILYTTFSPSYHSISVSCYS